MSMTVQLGARFGIGVVIMVDDEPILEGARFRRVARLICECGNEYRATHHSLRAKKTPKLSCGCIHGNKTHGLSHHPLYATWTDMMHRCYDTKRESYQYYGAQGIHVDKRWHDPARFVTDIEATIGMRPNEMSLDRIDTRDGYRPGNVRWATSRDQNHNRRKFRTSSSRYKGVTWHKGSRRWHARISTGGKNEFLGAFDDETDAALAYDHAARMLFGKEASTNKSLGLL